MRFIGYILVVVVCILPLSSKADEGMWLPYLLNDKQIDELQHKGLSIPFESVYSHSKSSLKDAIVALDEGACTGEFISSQGLLLTNHHCGYGEIQQHSSVAHNYLKNGFWAKSKSEELPNPGKTATILIEAHDVTSRINTLYEAPRSQRAAKIDSAIALIETEYQEKTKLEAKVKSFFSGNLYLVMLTKTFKDVRLVGTPPSSIGKFGGDTDNWMWPRHTGDFCFFRVYCAKDGSPAEYSKDNVPYTPKQHLKINLGGVKKGDFAMTLGYPGQTQRFLSSFGVNEIYEVINPIVSEVRGIKQDIWEASMLKNEEIDIKYAAKFSESSNYWKYAIGQNKGLDKLKIIDQKQAQEEKFTQWISNDTLLSGKYGKTLSYIEASYILGRKLTQAEIIGQETMLEGSDLVNFALQISSAFMELYEFQEGSDEFNEKLEAGKKTVDNLFKDFDATLDKKVFESMLNYYLKHTPKNMRPDEKELLGKKYTGDVEGYTKWLYKETLMTDKQAVMELINSGDEDKLFDDPAIKFAYKVLAHLYQLGDVHSKLNEQYDEAQRLLIDGYMKYNDKVLYPDANSTLRLSYGVVGDYEPKDGIVYHYKTTLGGIIEKENPEDVDFVVPEKLKELYASKNYGNYAEADGKMPVCFITNNDITGGNSGSPVLNHNGELIGVAFDGNWEAMTGDLAYEEKLQKCICVDIRYVLLIMDKMAGTDNLIAELEFVN